MRKILQICLACFTSLNVYSFRFPETSNRYLSFTRAELVNKYTELGVIRIEAEVDRLSFTDELLENLEQANVLEYYIVNANRRIYKIHYNDSTYYMQTEGDLINIRTFLARNNDNSIEALIIIQETEINNVTDINLAGLIRQALDIQDIKTRDSEVHRKADSLIRSAISRNLNCHDIRDRRRTIEELIAISVARMQASANTTAVAE